MNVKCRIFVGLTLEIEGKVDFNKVDTFLEEHDELDEYVHPNLEGKLLLIGDGTNGSFLRLIKVDKYIDGGSLGDANEFVELPIQGKFNPELIKTMFNLYEEYTGKRPDAADFKYAMWSQWY